MAYKGGELLAKQNLVTELGEERLRPFINFVLHYIADLDIPVKRGTFLEFRAGMINVREEGAEGRAHLLTLHSARFPLLDATAVSQSATSSSAMTRRARADPPPVSLR